MYEYMFSIIVPIYNEGEGMRNCVESLLKQNYDDYEIILVDDGSVDCSVKICDMYAERYDFIQVIHKKNGGGVAARRTGIEISRGKYIVFADGDDYVEDNYMEHLHRAVQNEADYYILNSQFYFYHSGKMELQKNNLKEGYINVEEAAEWLLCKADGYVWNKIYMAEVIKKNNIEFTKEIVFGDDVYINLLYLRHVNHIWVQNTASYIHIWDAPTSVCNVGISLKRFKEMDVVYEEVLGYAKQKKLPENIYMRFLASNLSVLVRTVAALAANGIDRKEILDAMEESSLVNQYSDYKADGLKYKLYTSLIRYRRLRLCEILWTVRSCVKN